MSETLPELYARLRDDPLSASTSDLDRVIEYQRANREKFILSGGKPPKVEHIDTGKLIL